MDFKNIQTTTEISLRAVFAHLYTYIPDKYRLQYRPEEVTKHIKEFYDPELTLDDRMTYKIARVPYEDRKEPWVALMWNTEGLNKSQEMFRRMDTAIFNQDEIRARTMKIRRVSTQVNLGFVSNSLTAMLELQEVLLLDFEDLDHITAKGHSVLGDYEVNILSVTPGTLFKLPRNKGTLCTYTMGVVLDYPIVGKYQGGATRITAINTTYNLDGGTIQDTILAEKKLD